MPFNTLNNYMYVMDCIIGTPPSGHEQQVNQCIFDTTTSISSTFAEGYTDYTDTTFDPHFSESYVDYQVTEQVDTIGLQFEGVQVQDTWCLGGGDVHTTVCLEQ